CKPLFGGLCGVQKSSLRTQTDTAARRCGIVDEIFRMSGGESNGNAAACAFGGSGGACDCARASAAAAAGRATRARTRGAARRTRRKRVLALARGLSDRAIRAALVRPRAGAAQSARERHA